MPATHAYAAMSPGAPLQPFTFERRTPGPHDVRIDIAYCGVCHTDVHHAKNDWGAADFPIVPGHEIVGTVSATGAGVTAFRPGDAVAVGSIVDSCRSCGPCETGLEQYCDNGMVTAYRGVDRSGNRNFGGYASDIVVDERYVLTLPPGLDPAAAAPLLCAGITAYSPLRHWHVGAHSVVGVIGLGGLGHMALKFAKAFGASVVLFTTSAAKVADARRLGADDVVLSSLDRESLLPHSRRCDLVVDTVSAAHNLNGCLDLLRPDGTLVMLGLPRQALAISSFALDKRRLSLSGSLVGGIRETQAMLDYCAERHITADVEVIAMHEVNRAYERVMTNDVKYRFVLDVASLRSH
jgi:uncharacterized zinc-type alcohol dehydrogenase-like protein